MGINKLIDEEIVSEINELSEVEVGTETYKTTIDGVTKLLDRKIELEKLDYDREMKNRQVEDEKRDRLIKNILSGVSIGSGIALTIWGTCKTLKFEETGTVTTSAGRRFVNKLFSWLK